MGTTNPAMKEALARLWIKFQPEMESRVALIETAVKALTAADRTLDERKTAYSLAQQPAHEAAHKLAGSLGVFGIYRGTELARQAELLLAGETAEGQEADLAAWAAELRSLVASRT